MELADVGVARLLSREPESWWAPKRRLFTTHDSAISKLVSGRQAWQGEQLHALGCTGQDV